jgi:hypothetical protein
MDFASLPWAWAMAGAAVRAATKTDASIVNKTTFVFMQFLLRFGFLICRLSKTLGRPSPFNESPSSCAFDIRVHVLFR